MASRASREGARRASPSRRMLWVSSRETRSSATIRSRCQRAGEALAPSAGRSCDCRGIVRFMVSPSVTSADMRQGNAYLGEQIQVGIVVDLDILAVPIDEAG